MVRGPEVQVPAIERELCFAGLLENVQTGEEILDPQLSYSQACMLLPAGNQMATALEHTALTALIYCYRHMVLRQ